MRSIKLLTILCLVSSCAQIPKPDSTVCVINAPSKHMKCYTLSKDYLDDGTLKPGAVATYKPYAELEDANKFIAMDPDSFALLKAYVKSLRQEYEKGCSASGQ